MQHVIQHKNGGVPPQVSLQVATDGSFQDLFRMKPSEFLGSLDLLKDHDWFSNIERVFQIMPCSEENMVIFASHMMKGSTTRWWDCASTLMNN